MNQPIKMASGTIGSGERKRVWLEAARLKETQFEPGTGISVEITPRLCVIRSTLLGERIVSQRRGKPVIDIDNKKLSQAFAGVTRVKVTVYKDRIEVRPLEEETKQQEAASRAKRPRTYAEIFCGGGTMSRAFSKAFEVKWGVEIEEKYLENFEAAHPDALSVNMAVQDIDWSTLPKVDVLAAGIPCEAWSVAGKAKAADTGKAVCELGDTGYLGYYVLEAVRALRPAFFVLENVEGFAKRDAPFPNIFRRTLEQAGYRITEKVFYAHEHGGMTRRKRYVMVASMAPFAFPKAADGNAKRVRDILETAPELREWLTESDSSSIATFLRREREHRQPGSGRNFGIGRVRLDDTVTPTVTKHYMKRQMTQPILVREREEKGCEEFSFFAPRELARLNGLDDSFPLPASATTACEIVGQGVDAQVFERIARAIAA